MEKYKPQPWQEKCHRSWANELLVGGAFGPGKSTFERHEALNWGLKIPKLHIYLFRRTFSELESNHIIPSLEQFPQGIGKYKDQKHRWELHNGSMIHFCHCQHEKDVFDYLSAEINLLIFDQMESFTEFQYDFLRARVRPSQDIPEQWRLKIPGIICAANPGGVGHNFIKRRWVKFAPPGVVKKAPDGEGGMNRCFIPGLLSDNPILLKRDPGCVLRVLALPEPYRTAYMGGPGAWDVFVGQAFDLRYDKHVIKPAIMPGNAHVYMTFDWGYSAPFCVFWWWVDSDGRLFMFDEWYGWNGTPNQGLKLTDVEIAQGIKEREKRNGADKFNVQRISGPDCFNKRPDHYGRGTGPSTAEIFLQQGLRMYPGDPNRSLKIRQFRERLKTESGSSQLPMLVVYDTCENFIRTIPEMQMDPKNPEDILTDSEDHCYDAAALMVMARPLKTEIEKPKEKESVISKHINQLIKEKEMIMDEQMGAYL